MARAYLARRKYKLSDLSKWLIVSLKEAGMSQAELARQMDIPQQTLNYRISNNQLSYSDLLSIFRILKTDDKTILKLMKE